MAPIDELGICACQRVRYKPDLLDGTESGRKRESWACELCGTRFVKEYWLKKSGDKLSVELQALADKDKNEVFYLERIADLESQLDQLKAGYKELEAEVAKLNGLLERCQADAEKIAERNQ